MLSAVTDCALGGDAKGSREAFCDLVGILWFFAVHDHRDDGGGRVGLKDFEHELYGDEGVLDVWVVGCHHFGADCFVNGELFRYRHTICEFGSIRCCLERSMVLIFFPMYLVTAVISLNGVGL